MFYYKSFDRPFSKGRAVKGAEPLSLVATSETSLPAFLFASFFFAPASCKEKVETTVETNAVRQFSAFPLGKLCLLDYIKIYTQRRTQFVKFSVFPQESCVASTMPKPYTDRRTQFVKFSVFPQESCVASTQRKTKPTVFSRKSLR